MKLRAPVRNVIFDMDGVLLDTEPIYTEVTNRVTMQYGKVFDWSIKADMIGRPAMDSAEYLVKALDLPILPEDYLDAAQGRCSKRVSPAAGAMPGAEAFTRELQRRGDPHRGRHQHRRPALRASRPQHHRAWFSTFDKVVCGDDPRVKRGKPAPRYLSRSRHESCDADPSSCVVFEDSPLGLAAALAAGMRVVAVPDPHMDRRPFRRGGLHRRELRRMHAIDLGAVENAR